MIQRNKNTGQQRRRRAKEEEEELMEDGEKIQKTKSKLGGGDGGGRRGGGRGGGRGREGRKIS